MVPCPLASDAVLLFDTSKVPDGEYQLRVAATDVAGNRAVSPPSSIRVANHATPNGSTPSRRARLTATFGPRGSARSARHATVGFGGIRVVSGLLDGRCGSTDRVGDSRRPRPPAGHRNRPASGRYGPDRAGREVPVPGAWQSVQESAVRVPRVLIRRAARGSGRSDTRRSRGSATPAWLHDASRRAVGSDSRVACSGVLATAFRWRSTQSTARHDVVSRSRSSRPTRRDASASDTASCGRSRRSRTASGASRRRSRDIRTPRRVPGRHRADRAVRSAHVDGDALGDARHVRAGSPGGGSAPGSGSSRATPLKR